MRVFTSAALNYLPKARVLASTLKQHHPEARMSLVLCDRLPDWLAADPGPFDEILPVEELPLANVRGWIFQHALVELCTAVKGVACQVLAERHPGEPLLYLDPDMAVLGPMTEVLEGLTRHDVLLTPHQTEPEPTLDGVADNELASLQHGVYNLGFLALAATPEARRFVDWWAQRLYTYCRDDIPHGLFTDQRWIDLAVAFFPTIGILRSPAYNVATWNLSRRTVSGDLAGGLAVNGQPLRLFHFSGFDSGAQLRMLEKYGRQNPALYNLRQWYIQRCRDMGQDELQRVPWAYGRFANGEPVSNHQRRIYRFRSDVQAAIPDPLVIDPYASSYLRWYLEVMPHEMPAETGVPADSLHSVQEQLDALREAHAYLQQWHARLGEENQAQQAELHAAALTVARLQSHLAELERSLAEIRQSRSYRLGNRLVRIARGLLPWQWGRGLRSSAARPV